MATRGGKRKPPQYNKNDRGSPSNSRVQYQRFTTNADRPHYTEGVYKNKRLVHLMTSLIGSKVEAEVVSGIVYEGILRTVSPQMEFVLELACKKPLPGQPITKSSIIPTLVIKWEEISRLSAPGFSGIGGVVNNEANKEIFKMDSDIATPSSNGHSDKKELEPFQFDDSLSSKVLEEEDEGQGMGGGWTVEEMFVTNEEKFNVGSTYDPEMTEYTTPLVLTGGESDQLRMEEATRKAKEIESSNNNQSQCDKDVDEEKSEEKLFSAVIRPNEVKQEELKSIAALPTECAKEDSTNTNSVMNGEGEEERREEKKEEEGGGEENSLEDSSKNEVKKEKVVSSFKLNPDAQEFKPSQSPASSGSTHSLTTSPSLTSRSQRQLKGSGPRGNQPRPPIYTPQDQSSLYGAAASYIPTGNHLRMLQPGSLASPTGIVSMIRPTVYGSQLIGPQGNQFYSIPTSLPGTPTHPSFNQAALLGHPAAPHGLGIATAPQGNVVYVPVPAFGQYPLPTSPLGPGGGGGTGILSYPQP